MNTTTVVEALLFHLNKGATSPAQRAMAERVSATYVAEYGEVTDDTKPSDIVARLQSLVMRDILRDRKGEEA